MLTEYNFGGMNSAYQGNVISKWLEGVLRNGDLINDDRLGDLILQEIDRELAEYQPLLDGQYAKFVENLRFKGPQVIASNVPIEEGVQDDTSKVVDERTDEVQQSSEGAKESDKMDIGSETEDEKEDRIEIEN